MDESVESWCRRGVDCRVRRRTNRQGYKAGAMKEGLEELASADFIAIFDADFKPEPDFLLKTASYMVSSVTTGLFRASILLSAGALPVRQPRGRLCPVALGVYES